MSTTLLRLVTGLLLFAEMGLAQTGSYIGFDRNDYPGDDLLPSLHRTFVYTSYWLNNPPGSNSNSWVGKRSILLKNGFGFLILFNGRTDAELKNQNPSLLAHTDAAAAINAATKEGFPKHAILFLDLEEGGHLLPEQAEYVWAWIATVRNSGYRPGVYCSGIPVPNDLGQTITTAEEIRAHDPNVSLWVVNDVCPPSPGCSIQTKGLSPSASGIPDTLVWQYAQSPRRAEFTGKCVQTYSPDNYCYAPGLAQNNKTFLDLNVSTSSDPSLGR
jgi:Domain of unknown function (DUF1906)